MSTFGERLQTAMVAGQFTSTSLAEKICKQGCKVSRQTVDNWLAMKEAGLSGTHLTHLGLVLGYAIIWLALGIGDPTPIWLAQRRVERLMKRPVT